MKVSLIIPAYNEENYIHQTCIEFKKALDAISGLTYTIIVVNDSSSDSTRQKMEALAKQDLCFTIINHPTNLGKGAAIRSALKNIEEGIVVLGDADMELDPHDISRLVEPILKNEVDLVNGSRYLGAHDKRNTRTIINKIYTLFFSLLVFKRVTDFACGYKAFKKNSLQNISLKEDRFCIEAELMMKMCRHKVLFKEVAVSYTSRTSKQGKKLTNLDAIKILFSIIKYRFSQ